MSFDDVAAVAVEPEFRARVRAAVITCCRIVRQSPPSVTDKPRRALALATMLAPDSLTDAAAWALASTGLTEESEDTDLQTAADALLIYLSST